MIALEDRVDEDHVIERAYEVKGLVYTYTSAYRFEPLLGTKSRKSVPAWAP